MSVVYGYPSGRREVGHALDECECVSESKVSELGCGVNRVWWDSGVQENWDSGSLLYGGLPGF